MHGDQFIEHADDPTTWQREAHRDLQPFPVPFIDRRQPKPVEELPEAPADSAPRHPSARRSDVRHYKAGIARAVAIFVGMTFVGLLPFHVFWFGWRLALTHALAGWLCALLASEWVVLRRWGVPFVTALSDKTANPAPRVSLFVIAFLAYALGFAALEDRAMHGRGGLEWLTFILLILLVAAMTVRHVQSRVSDRRSIRGADHEPSLQTLGVTAEP